MEEMKNNQQDEVMEQRPSMKYGRTAYQEQMRQEQATQESVSGENTQSGWDSSAQQNSYQQNPYQGNEYQQQSWEDRYSAYTPYQEPKVEVKNTFAYILMVLVAFTAIINFAASMMTMDAFNQLQSLDTMAVLDLLAESVGFTVLSYVGDMIFWVTVVFLVLDIMAIYKANHKITGAILFAIFLRPAYFIWRAHLLEQKKTVGIAYTVCYYVFCIIEYIALFNAAFDLVTMLMY